MLINHRGIESITFRATTMADLAPVVELLNICSRAQIGVDEHTEAEVTGEWHTPGFNLERDTRIAATPEGKIVGYIEVWTTHKTPVHPWVYGRVHPEYEGQGIGTTLLQWAEKRARAVIEQVPADARVTMHSGAVSTYDPAIQLLEGQGMTRVRSFWHMVTDLDRRIPLPQWHEGITLETYESERLTLADTVRAFRETFRDHWGFIENDFEEDLRLWQHRIESEPDFDPSLWFFAMDGEEIAGFSLCLPKTTEDPEMGWVGILGVRRPWRRRGLAMALLHHTFGEFQRRGQKRVGLGVDASSLTGATRLYEQAGMYVARRIDAYEKELRPGHELSTSTLQE